MPPYGVTVRACQAMASTVGGQRSILKKPMSSVKDYIRRAVESGVYRTDEELALLRKERKDGNDDLRVLMRRFRQDIVRGSSVHDYPTEYLILEQHPPIPDPPRTPVKFLRQLQAPPDPVERLTKKYFHRQQKQESSGGSSSTSGGNSGGPVSTEEYYRRLLGVQAAGNRQRRQLSPSSLHLKPAAVQKAYAAAVAHYQLQRGSGGALSDNDAMRQVDELLSRQSQSEQEASRERTRTAQAYREQSNHRAARNKQAAAAAIRKEVPRPVRSSRDAFPFKPVQAGVQQVRQAEEDDAASAAHALTLESIFASSPRTLEGMMRWSERLAAVPYREWTVGAGTALDHWIARQVLGLAEETWQSALEGADPDLLSIGRDIVACREALFPETAAAALTEGGADAQSRSDQEDSMMEDVASAQAAEEEKEKTRSIEDLLQRLGGLKPPDAATFPGNSGRKDDWSFLREAEEDADTDAKVERLVNELQMYRRRNMVTPYDDWIPSDKEQFHAWMKTYVSTVASAAERHRPVDYDSTREALLSEPPVTADEADEFWSQLQDQRTAAALLDAMVEGGPPPGATILQSAFWDLPRADQLERLNNLGALRPLLDEYTKESDRLRFLQRHGDTILAGVELEHLVADDNGPVKTSDLSPDVVQAMRIPESARFRLEMLPYKSSAGVDALETSRALFKAWNEHKAGRARYEERLFQTGRLGLRYNDKIPDDESWKKKG